MSELQQVRKSTTTCAEALLLDFLRDHDAACPVCGYNVRGLTRPMCPECKQDLALTVGSPQLHLGWLLVALIPGFFSGVAACFMCIPTVAIFFEDGTLILPLVFAVLFGWSSFIFAILLASKRRHRARFLARSRRGQRWFAVTVWLTHIAAFVLFIIMMAPAI